MQMANITIKDYFTLSEILKNQDNKTIQDYQKSINYQYNKDEKLKELYKFYDNFKDKQSFNINLFEKLNNIKKILLTIIFLISFFITYNYFDNEINIKTYLLFSVALPLIYSLFTLIKITRYKYPQKDETSFLNTFIKKISSNFENKHNHILKTYSIVMFVEIGISYAVGILVATMIIFWSHSITFYSETSYSSTNTTIEKIQTKKDRVIVSKSYWSKLITLLIFLVISLKIVLRYFANKVLQKTINNSLEEQAQLFFDVMQTNTNIYKNSIDKEDNTVNKQEFYIQIEKNQSSIYHKLYYEIEFEDAKNIEFKDDTLKEKSFKEYSFALFDRDDEDEEVLQELSNLVLIFTSPESLADETFKNYIQQMLQNPNIVQIWILPLVQQENKLILSKKGDEKYFDYKKKIEKMINNDRVSLYNER